MTPGPWSTIRSVSLELTSAASGLTPESGTSTRETIVSWDPVVGAADYQVQFAPGSSPDWASPNVQSFITATTVFEFEDPAAFGVKTYTWRVRVRDWEGHLGPWSAVRTITRTLSDAPTLVTPANGSTVGSVAPLAWTPVKRASQYRVEVAADAGFRIRVGTHVTTETSFDLTTREEVIPYVLQKGETYYWRVMGIDRSNEGIADERPASPWSSTRSFVYDPPVTELLTPADGATIAVPTLTWSPHDARSHRVVIEDVTGTIVDEARTWASSYTPQVLLDPADGPFTWYLERVATKASRSERGGPRSDPLS
jgi:large repetitive protein